MMGLEALRPRLDVESLERRDTPAFAWHVDTLPTIYFTQAASITYVPFSNGQPGGTVKVTGTDSDDIIRVVTEEPVLAPWRAFNLQDNTIIGTRTVVR